MSVKCSWSGSQYQRSQLATTHISPAALVEQGVGAEKAMRLGGTFAHCPGCGRELKLRKGLHNRAYLMIPQHNKEGIK